MFQIQFDYVDAADLASKLVNIESKVPDGATALFHVYVDTLSQQQAGSICDQIRRMFPQALYVCFSTFANLNNGMASYDTVTIACTVFEDPLTRVQLLSYDLAKGSMTDFAAQIKAFLKLNPWAQCAELVVNHSYKYVCDICRELAALPEDFVIFGGGAYSEKSHHSFMITDDGLATEEGAVFVAIGGPALHVRIEPVLGWLPIGRTFRVTKIKGNVLYELDGKPAFDAYSRYLDIEQTFDDSFLSYVREFPLMMKNSEVSGENMLRAAVGCNPDGSMIMGCGDMQLNDVLRISYGNPDEILRSSHVKATLIANEYPDVVWLYSCRARVCFWGEDRVHKETDFYSLVAPSCGFYTTGEFMRTRRQMYTHNVTLLAVGLREGPPKFRPLDPAISAVESMEKRSINNRLVSLLTAASMELEEANQRLELMAIQDSLTMIFNRKGIQAKIDEALRIVPDGGRMSLVMFDIDDFKQVNDTLGHAAGDQVLVELAKAVRAELRQNCQSGSLGRWGGEEFMAVLPGFDGEAALGLAERFRQVCERHYVKTVGHKTISLGVAEAAADDDADSLCSRVDKAMYQAKTSGKNRVCQL